VLYFVNDNYGVGVNTRRAGGEEMLASYWLPSAVHMMLYEVVSRSFRAGHLERELQMVQLSATRYSCIAIL